jgi:putative oxidoreductase
MPPRKACLWPQSQFRSPACSRWAGGLSILLGYRAKIGAWLLIAFVAAVTPMMHNFWTVADPMMRQMQFIMFMKNVSMLGGALLVTQLGTGPWSLDARGK